ncbi:hypothetical protein HGA06_09345 [Streptomyces somaliensis DSM 40738]|uniref:Integral membrane protein n=1 Tax=Streptomyces somaliensis (strain ATCC 33201 / DSM 40738 / JCM 12659 / KCTC 9044 / NCTC 11332 / NRRL B-12077 / IP 733) TaxID=1134445 RepID=A0AA44DDG6_STRE0|nr:hypothetical protein [Streptomyces somaliensis DSM 40738]
MLIALAVALVPAFVLVPGPLAAGTSGSGFDDRRHLVDSLSSSFVDHWRSGERDLSPDLARAVDHWLHFHVVKAVIAAALLAVLAALGVLLWRAFLRTGGPGAGRGAALATAGAVVTVLGLASSAAVLANVQGAVAPLSSLLSMLPAHSPHGGLADTLDQVGHHLADRPDTGGRTPPAVGVMVGDFARYHLVAAVAALTAAVVLGGLSAVSWRRFAGTGRSDRRTRRVFGSFGLLWALSSAAYAVVAVANASVAADPAPALLAFFEGGW